MRLHYLLSNQGLCVQVGGNRYSLSSAVDHLDQEPYFLHILSTLLKTRKVLSKANTVVMQTLLYTCLNNHYEQTRVFKSWMILLKILMLYLFTLWCNNFTIVMFHRSLSTIQIPWFASLFSLKSARCFEKDKRPKFCCICILIVRSTEKTVTSKRFKNRCPITLQSPGWLPRMKIGLCVKTDANSSREQLQVLASAWRTGWYFFVLVWFYQLM